MADIQHSQVAANGCRFHVATAGDPAKPMLLFLHGFPEFWYAWRNQLADLSDQFFCIAPDTRGVNESQRFDDLDAYTLPVLAADAAGLIKAFGQQSATVIGHDWGGFAAWETAIRHPDVVDRLVIVNCAHPGIMSEELRREGSQQQTCSQYMLAFRSEMGEMLVSRNDFEGFRTNILEPQVAAGHLTAEDVARYKAAWLTPGSLNAGLNYYRANKSGPPSGDDAAPRSIADTPVTMPTMVIWGEGDPYFAPECVSRMPEAVPDLQMHCFPDADHWIVHQRSDDVSRLIREFAL